MAMRSKTVSADEALERLEALCARSERCSDELRVKMRAWGLGRDEAEGVLASLRERRFVDDERYARAYARDRWQLSRWGRRKILAGLGAKRIPAAAARAAVAEAVGQEEYYAGLLALARTKLVRLGGRDAGYDEGMKAMRSLVAAGYEPELAARALREAAQALAEGADDGQA